MGYEYQAKNGSCIEVVNMMAGSKDLSKPMVDELDEVYRKAKVFDAIVNIQDDFVEYHGFYPCVEEYAEEVGYIISEYLEDK